MIECNFLSLGGVRYDRFVFQIVYCLARLQ